MSRKAHIVTFGCQMNRHETGIMEALLKQDGYELTASPEDAGVVVIETCAIRQKAEDKAVSLMGRLRKRKLTDRPDLKVAVCGCLVTPDSAVALSERYGIDVLLSPRRIARIAEALRETAHGPVIDIGTEWALPPDEIVAPDIPGVSAFVTVMQGCSNACTFCVVPGRRGEAESRPVAAIVEEVASLAALGYREVTLIGQNISYYGMDRPERLRLIDLLRAVEERTEIPRIRFMTSHPAYVDRRFIDGFGRLERVAPHLHLPVQSGANAVLSRMRRGYTVERYMEIIDGVRAVRPAASITTDIIAGFDGETDSDHDETLRLIDRIRFDGAYVYHYSERPGTPAVNDTGRVPVPVTTRRVRCGEILAAVEAAAAKARAGDIGSEFEVLVERAGVGRCPRNIAAFFEGGAPGEFRRFRVEGVTPFALKGTLLPRTAGESVPVER